MCRSHALVCWRSNQRTMNKYCLVCYMACMLTALTGFKPKKVFLMWMALGNKLMDAAKPPLNKVFSLVKQPTISCFPA
jgi:hypothetical protein